MASPRRLWDGQWRRADQMGLLVVVALAGMTLTLRTLATGRLARPAWRADRPVVEQVRRRIDPNTASAASLRRLPGIGPVKAAAIVEFRQQAAQPFTGLEDLENVKGIGAGTTARIAPYVHFPASRTQPAAISAPANR